MSMLVDKAKVPRSSIMPIDNGHLRSLTVSSTSRGFQRSVLGTEEPIDWSAWGCADAHVNNGVRVRPTVWRRVAVPGHDPRRYWVT
jgi:hypothetical protein